MARRLKGQTSLFYEHEEAMKLIRAADDFRNTKAKTVRYKKRGYGVKIKSAVLTDKLSKEESESVVSALNSAIDATVMTLCHKASEITNGIVLRMSEEIKPSQDRESVVVDPDADGQHQDG